MDGYLYNPKVAAWEFELLICERYLQHSAEYSVPAYTKPFPKQNAMQVSSVIEVPFA